MPNYFSNNTSFHPLDGVSSQYHVHDKDESSDPKYYGFVDSRGTWVIMKETTSTGTFRYSVGKTNYSTNWTNRASLSYGYFNDVT
mgnify:CR=1 FL=1